MEKASVFSKVFKNSRFASGQRPLLQYEKFETTELASCLVNRQHILKALLMFGRELAKKDVWKRGELSSRPGPATARHQHAQQP